MTDKVEVKRTVDEIASYMYKYYINHDPLGRRENELKEAMAPLVRIIKRQRKEIEQQQERIKYLEIVQQAYEALKKAS